MIKKPLEAIHQHCKNCIVDSHVGNGTSFEQTEACTSYNCTLYDLRPITSREKSRRKAEKLKSLSKEALATYEVRRAAKAKQLGRNIAASKQVHQS